jgi:hypothetical protein
MLTEQYSKSFAKAGGVGISNDVYRADPAASQAAPARPRETDMNQHPQRQPAPAPIPMASTPAEARKLAEI